MPVASWSDDNSSEWVDGPETEDPLDAVRYQFGLESRTNDTTGYSYGLRYRLHYTSESAEPHGQGHRMLWMTTDMARGLSRFLQKWLIEQGQANAGN